MSEQAKRNIYEKMTVIKLKLLGIKKGGKNDFAHYSYFELGDILPILMPALQQEGLFMMTQFSASEQTAKLSIFEIDNPDNRIVFESKVAECSLKGAHEVQNLGAAQTYLRRYLILNAFDIVEADTVDAGAEPEKLGNKKPQSKSQHPTSKSEQSPTANPQNNQLVPADLSRMKRDIWELIKLLPEDQRTEWINTCKDANEDGLKELMQNLNKQVELNTRAGSHPLTDAEETVPSDKTTTSQKKAVKKQQLEIY